MIPVFLSCPVRPIEGETKESNLTRARRYYRTLSLALPGYAFIAPWILNCEVFPETDEMIALGMKRNKFWIGRCHELWWCGPRVASGMRDEGESMSAGGGSWSEGGWVKVGGIVRRVEPSLDGKLLVARNVQHPDDRDIVEIGPASLFAGIEDAREHALRGALALLEQLDHRGGLGFSIHDQISAEIVTIKAALDG